MAMKTQGGVTVLTPTGWKWFAAAAFTFFLFPPFSLLVAIFFVLTGLGVTQRLTLSPDGIKIRNLFSDKVYRWDEIDDFRIYKVKSGLITAANMVSFTHVNQQGTMVGKATKFLVGGTHSIPAVGIKAQKLVLLMQAYKLGHVAPETELAPAPQAAAAPLLGAPVTRTAAKPMAKTTPRPRAVPATPRAQQKAPAPKAGFGKKRSAATPLVQGGGGVFGRRLPDSPFKS
ncbi:MAG: PH domain-containing protein [Pseudomonadota bacterium]